MPKAIAALAGAALLASLAQAQEVLQDFESGQGDWYADNGAWELGTPTNVGPADCHQGDQCIGTVIDDFYRNGTSSRLVSPPTLLGTGTPQDPLNMSFFHYFEWLGGDGGVVEVSVWDEALLEWSDWIGVSTTFSGVSGTWTLNLVDLTDYSQELVRIGFLHMSSSSQCCQEGWYLDDITIPGTQIPPRPITVLQDFEDGQGNWFADNGVWEIGAPTNIGPAECHGGNQCMGTVIDDFYPNGTSSRLISPPFVLGIGTPQDPLNLRFFHWFDWLDGDGGIVQISVWDEVLLEWSSWIDVSTTFLGASGAWTLNIVDLTDFAQELVRIGFFHMSASSQCCQEGWYVDDIAITTPPIFADGFESGDTTAWSNTVP